MSRVDYVKEADVMKRWVNDAIGINYVMGKFHYSRLHI